MSAPTSRLMVYDGAVAIGEIIDHSRAGFLAYQMTLSGPVLIGTFPTRREAMRAVSVHSPTPPSAA